MTESKLATHERLAALLIGSCFLLLTLHTFFLSHSPTPGNITPHTNIEVTINGAVSAAGDYELPTGTILSDLLEQAQPTRDADLSRLRTQRKLKNGEEITIPTQKKLTIYLNGEPVQIPKGTRLCDLRLWIDLDPKIADQLKAKRLLKDGEQINYP